MILNISVYEKVVFINESKSCEISIQMFFNLMFSLFSGSISHGASNEPETYLESSQKSTRERFYKNS